MKTRFAVARFSLLHDDKYYDIRIKSQTHPTAPVPVVIMSTCRFGLVANSCRIFSRLAVGHSPSMRLKFDEFSDAILRYISSKSRVRVQHVKMMLDVCEANTKILNTGSHLPLRVRDVCQYIFHQGLHLRRLSLRPEIRVFL